MRVLPFLPFDLTLVLDFLKCFGILVDYKDRGWSFKGDPTELNSFDLEKWSADHCCGITELTGSYLVSSKVMEAISAGADAMLADDVIEPSYSGWSSPIVMVKKPDGSYRFCLDFRKVNSVTKRDAYPLPQMNGILHKL